MTPEQEAAIREKDANIVGDLAGDDWKFGNLGIMDTNPLLDRRTLLRALDEERAALVETVKAARASLAERDQTITALNGIISVQIQTIARLEEALRKIGFEVPSELELLDINMEIWMARIARAALSLAKGEGT